MGQQLHKPHLIESLEKNAKVKGLLQPSNPGSETAGIRDEVTQPSVPRSRRIGPPHSLTGLPQITNQICS